MGGSVHTPPADGPLEVEYADLAIIDVSKADTVTGRKALAAEVVRAIASHGFFYVINHRYTQEQVREPGAGSWPIPIYLISTIKLLTSPS
jgi:hypothetical protein